MLSFATKSLANTITLINILLGSLAIIYIINQHYNIAAILIIIAVFMDGLDGKVARKFQITSDLGKQLDSLCDLVSFGVAPAILIYAKVFNQHSLEILGIVFTLLFVMCGAFRLARFNTLNIPDHFIGIPITFAGFIIAAISFAFVELPFIVSIILLFILSYLMISNIRVPKW
ncbi:CDP-diacylglycerol--serine O-phosphatidyltransferase [Candidatus Syntrophocurvum alkaliphilum]|uniref:CDP-diacylglycerol--serine O-phosphatidyltransferase n=1 Tax=Candidatus Syntrophocurvum alkaliphilum TaxID=2293317 RepID=A0A6I6DG78_9FIRM|nr:CDP-diacylglycerol--serine O-phosphatidyltransferase [Candidatus Syntrophocurvum alkaliphilum]QGT99410.1 CDP-diacylglycerol--serine O-phosphatidyltransferase [Candidatus Syntrophocurvum alkaliphilum]